MDDPQLEQRSRALGFLLGAKEQLEAAKPRIDEAKFRILDAKDAARNAGLPGEDYLVLCHELDVVLRFVDEMVERATRKMSEVEVGSRG